MDGENRSRAPPGIDTQTPAEMTHPFINPQQSEPLVLLRIEAYAVILHRNEQSIVVPIDNHAHFGRVRMFYAIVERFLDDAVYAGPMFIRKLVVELVYHHPDLQPGSA